MIAGRAWKINFSDKAEMYLVWSISINDCINPYTYIRQRKKNLFYIKIVQYSIDQFDE